MKKLFLTGAMALMGFMVSAQGFAVATNLDLSGDEEFEFSSLTDNLSAFYACNDALWVGITLADAAGDSVYTDANGNVTVVEGAHAAAEMQLAVRYYYNDNLYLSLTSPWSVEDDFDASPFDYARIGAGYSFNIWNNINVEPNYTMNISELENAETLETSRRGKFTLGISASF